MSRYLSIGTERGQYKELQALVDDEDYELVSTFNWSVSKSNNVIYARTEVLIQGRRVCFFMHRFILGVCSELFTDHRNGNGLDNRKENLRICDASSNAKNRKLNSDNSTGYKGVTFEFGKYRAIIHNNKKKIHLGMFSTPVEAALAYDEAANKLHGEFARTNLDLGLL